MHTPVNPSFTIQKWGLRGSKLHMHVFVMNYSGLARKVIYEGILFHLCYFVLVFVSPFSITITSLGEERANFSVFRTFVRFALVWFCLFPLLLGVLLGLRFVIVALPVLFSYLFWYETVYIFVILYTTCM